MSNIQKLSYIRFHINMENKKDNMGISGFVSVL